MKYVVMLLALIMLASCGFEVVDTGYRGVQTRFGKVTGGSLEEGMHFYNPATSNITEMDVREQRWNEDTLAYTKDVQNVKVSFTLNYYLEPTKVHEIYRTIGKDWENKLVPQVVIGKIKEVVGNYKAEDLVTNRLKATNDIQTTLTAKLKTKNVVVKNFEITNLDYNDKFENAIEAKVVAVQKAKESINKSVRIKEEAKQKVMTAQADATAMRIKAKALSQNKALVEYEAVRKWNGVLPTMTMGGAMPFINVKAGK